jgi:hypothetical protein
MKLSRPNRSTDVLKTAESGRSDCHYRLALCFQNFKCAAAILAGAVQIGYHISVAHHFYAAVSLRHGRSIENSV